MIKRLEQLAEDPYDARTSVRSSTKEACANRASASWRIIFAVDQPSHALKVVTIERRGQVYKRI